MPEPHNDEFDWDAFIGDTMDASAATVGAWMRCLYRMRRSTTRGQITRNAVGFGRLFGTSPDQATAIVAEIESLEIGEVERQQNGEVTLTNRRMFRKFQADKKAAERQQRFKDKQKSEEDNASVTESVTPRLQTGHIYSLNPKEAKASDQEERKEKRNMSSAEIQRIFTYWQTHLKHPKALLTRERRNAIEARLKDGYSVEDLESAIEGCGKSSYHMGNNEHGTVYDDIELICRKGSKVEQFIGYLAQGKQNGTGQKGDGGFSGSGTNSQRGVSPEASQTLARIRGRQSGGSGD
jgi:hypothetical protein